MKNRLSLLLITCTFVYVMPAQGQSAWEAAEVTTPTYDQQFNGTPGGTVNVQMRSDHYVAVSQGDPFTAYNFLATVSYGFLSHGGQSVQNVQFAVLTDVQGIGESNTVQGELSQPLDVYDGITYYGAWAQTVITQSLIGVVSDWRYWETRFKVYGEG